MFIFAFLMTTEEKILRLFKKINDLTVAELVRETGTSKQLVHRILKSLVEKGTIVKLGMPPKTIYRVVKKKKAEVPQNFLDEKQNEFLLDNFLLITEMGEYLEGFEGFALWCNKRNLPVEKTFKEFAETKKKYEKYYNLEGLIDGMEKLKNTKGYDAIYLNNLYYLDFYAIERFGKTRLGTILHYAKQGQNKFLMQKLIQEIGNKVEDFIQSYQIDAVGFVPPTIKRETQLIQFLRNGLKLNVPEVNIQKISGIIPVPQKSLSKIDERINNADNTFAVFEKHQYKTVLLLDDAVGSGATLNQIAKKLLEKKVAKKVIGLAIVGSFKGFDVITDV
jgi:DNA-binding Lrp family transcriptional regulator